jgi:hypothetical protein
MNLGMIRSAPFTCHCEWYFPGTACPDSVGEAISRCGSETFHEEMDHPHLQAGSHLRQESPKRTSSFELAEQEGQLGGGALNRAHVS